MVSGAKPGRKPKASGARPASVKGTTVLGSSSARAKPGGKKRIDDNALPDPIDTALGHSTPLRPILDMSWPGSGLPYLAPNVALAFQGAALRAGPRGQQPDQVTASDLLAAVLAVPLIRPGAWTAPFFKELSSLGGSAATVINPAFVRRWRAVAGGKAPRLGDHVLRWDAVALLAQATALRRETNFSFPQIGLRHICFAALFIRDGHKALDELGLLSRGLDAVVELLCRQIEASSPSDSPRRYGDDMKAWDDVVRRARAQRLLIAPRPRSGFIPDAIASEADDDGNEVGRAGPPSTDPLGSRTDARALADVILLESAHPPLAIGLLGSWGSGKSTLMRRLREEIARQTREVRDAGGESDVSPEMRRVRNVAQLEFNAWSFVDSENLWASLTAEIFEQLRAGGGKEWSRQQGQALVREVADKIALHEVDAARAQTEVEARQNDLEAVDLALADVRRESAAKVVEKVVEDLKLLFPGRISNAFRDLAMDEPKPDLSSWPKRLGFALRVIRRAFPIGWWLFLLLIVAGAGAGAIFYARLQQWFVWPSGAAMAMALAASGYVWRVLLRVGRLDAAYQNQQAELRAREKAIAQTRAAAVKAKEEAVAREATASANAEQLDRMAKDPAGLLHYLLSESADIKEIRQKIGLLATVRRCFETLNAIVRKNRGDQNSLDRIVLYVDDLDRCNADQVVRVLEAVHLLLAFECFVVVVAIDARWLRRSLILSHEQFRATAWDDGDEEYGHPSPTDYLEKIFQIPFWIRPLTPSVSDQPSAYSLYLEQLVGSAEAPAPDARTPQGKSGQASTQESAAGRFEPVAPEMPAGEDRTRTERVQLSPAEHKLLEQLGPLAAKSPRAVKRLVNIYRLIRASLSQDQEAAFLGSGSTEIPRYGYILFALALDAGVAAGSVADIRDGIAAFTAAGWDRLIAKPDLLLGPDPFGPTEVADNKAFNALKKPLSESGREAGFVAAMNALIASGPAQLDQGAIDLAFRVTQRYSFRAP